LKKPIPELRTDEAAERFVETADLSEYDLSGFVPTRFEFQPKAAQLNMRLPLALLDAVKESAKARGIPYTRFVQETLEQAVAGQDRTGR
jgi:predicted DNA binding CopG/RHH family protein